MLLMADTIVKVRTGGSQDRTDTLSHMFLTHLVL